MSTVVHPEMDGLSQNSNKTVTHYLYSFSTHDQANLDNYLPLVQYAFNSSVHHWLKQMPFELDLGCEPPLLLDSIPDLQWLQANASAKTIQGREFIKRLQRNLGVARDELCNPQDQQMAETNKLWGPMDPAITAGANAFRDTKDL